MLYPSMPQFPFAALSLSARSPKRCGATAATSPTRFKINSVGGCFSQGFESSRLVLTVLGRDLGGKTNPHPAATSLTDVSGGVTGSALVVDLPAEQIELLWGDATCLVVLMKLVTWGSSQLGPPNFWRKERGEQPWSGTVQVWVCRMEGAEAPPNIPGHGHGEDCPGCDPSRCWTGGQAPTHHPTQRRGSRGSRRPRPVMGSRGEEKAGGIYLLVGTLACIRRAGCCPSRSSV